MEGNNGESSAGIEGFKDTVQPFAQGIQLAVHSDAQRLEGAAAGVFVLAAHRGRQRRRDGIGQLQGGQDGLAFPQPHDMPGNRPGVGFLAVLPQDAGQFLPAGGVDQIGGSGAALAHPHIQRRVHPVREAPLPVVQLMAGHAQIQQCAVQPVNAQLPQHGGGIAEVGLHHSSGQTRQSLGGHLNGIRVLVQADEAAGGQPAGNRAGVPGPAGGTVQINAVRFDGKPVQTFLQQHGLMAEFHDGLSPFGSE